MVPSDPPETSLSRPPEETRAVPLYRNMPEVYPFTFSVAWSDTSHLSCCVASDSKLSMALWMQRTMENVVVDVWQHLLLVDQQENDEEEDGEEPLSKLCVEFGNDVLTVYTPCNHDEKVHGTVGFKVGLEYMLGDTVLTVDPEESAALFLQKSKPEHLKLVILGRIYKDPPVRTLLAVVSQPHFIQEPSSPPQHVARRIKLKRDRSAPRDDRPPPLHHAPIERFLANRPPEEERDDIRGKERDDLKAEILPLLPTYLKNRWGTVVVDGEKKFDGEKFNSSFDTWLTSTSQKCRGFVIRPERTNSLHVPRRAGEPNGYTKDAIREKNQQPHIKESKRQWELKNPGRMKKWYGTEEMKLWKETHQCKVLLRRQAELEKELARTFPKLSPEDLHDLANDIYNKKGILEEYPTQSIKELVENGIIMTYFGLVGSNERLQEEPTRFLIKGNVKHPVLMLSESDGLVQLAPKDMPLLDVRSVILHKQGSLCGFPYYMLERELQSLQRDLELGTQRLNRVVGAGNAYRDVPGVYSVYLTYMKTEVFDQFPNLTVWYPEDY